MKICLALFPIHSETMNMRRLGPWALSLIGITLYLAFQLWLTQSPALFEPDRLYHFAILREAVRQHAWAIHTWTQFPLLNWQNIFVDKEFLFHLLLLPPYRLLGENAALFTGLLFSALTAFLPFLAPGRTRWFALLLSLSIFFFHPYILFRFALLRPHTLAGLIFGIFLYGIYFRRFGWAAAGLFLFPLAYHAFYVPLFVLLALATADHASTKKELWPKLPWLLLAFSAGILVNPYFPGNIVRGLQHLFISFRAMELQEDLHLKFGQEVLTPNPLEILVSWFSIGALMIWAMISHFRRGWRRVPLLTALGLCSLFLLAGAFRNLRVLDFSLPLWILFLSQSFASAPKIRKAGILLVILIPQLPAWWGFVTSVPHPKDPFLSPSVAEMRELLAPVAGKSARLFYDNWGLGSYVAYILPEAEGVDLLDPTFLLLANPRLAGLRTALTEGRVPKVVEAIREAFGARFVLCEPSALRLQLEKIPGVKQLRATPNNRFALFELPPP